MKRSRPQKSPALVWKTLSKRAWKTDLGGKLPEVLILRMSDAEFQKFHASKDAAKKFLDELLFLKQKLIKVKFCDVVPNKSGEEWFVIIPHTTHSTAVVVAWQAP